MNDEEIDKYRERREKHFWEFFFIKVAIILSILFIVGCQQTSSQRGIPQPYNLTLMGNSTGYVQLVQLVSSNLMDDLFGIMTLIAVFVISMMAFIASTNHPLKAAAVSNFIVFILSLFLRTINLVPDYAVYISLAMVAITVIFLIPRD